MYLESGKFNRFLLYFAQNSFTEMRSIFIQLQNETLPKAIDHELFMVNSSV